MKRLLLLGSAALLLAACETAYPSDPYGPYQGAYPGDPNSYPPSGPYPQGGTYPPPAPYPPPPAPYPGPPGPGSSLELSCPISMSSERPLRKKSVTRISRA